MAERNIVCNFANNKQQEHTQYDKERLYRPSRADCKIRKGIRASGAHCHHVFSRQSRAVLFRRHPRRAAHCQGHRLATPEGTEGGGADTGRGRSTESALLHQLQGVERSPPAFRRVFRPVHL